MRTPQVNDVYEDARGLGLFLIVDINPSHDKSSIVFHNDSMYTHFDNELLIADIYLGNLLTHPLLRLLTSFEPIY